VQPSTDAVETLDHHILKARESLFKMNDDSPTTKWRLFGGKS
jgi:hypothetical protein